MGQEGTVEVVDSKHDGVEEGDTPAPTHRARASAEPYPVAWSWKVWMLLFMLMGGCTARIDTVHAPIQSRMPGSVERKVWMLLMGAWHAQTLSTTHPSRAEDAR